MFHRYRSWIKPRTKNSSHTRRHKLFVEELERRELLSTGLPPGGMTSLTPDSGGTTPVASGAQLPLGPHVVSTASGGLTASQLNLSLYTPAGATGPLQQATPFGAGYTPSQIESAYGFNQLPSLFPALRGNYNNAGAGQTIAIFETGTDPEILSEANAFSAAFNLPDFNSGRNTPTLKVVNQYGGTDDLPGDEGAAFEIALDVEWAHAIAPAANLLVVSANSFSPSDVAAALLTAASAPGVSVVSMSYGISESFGFFGSPGQFDSFDEYLSDGLFTTPVGHQPVSFFLSAGDNGAANGNGPIYPGISPNVISVGGTTLPSDGIANSQNPLGNPVRSEETGWSYGSDSFNPGIAGGGGISSIEAEPAYQDGVSIFDTAGNPSGTNTVQNPLTGFRTNPDFAYDSDPATGFPVFAPYAVVNYEGGSASTPWVEVGGTSDAAPQMAAFTAIVNQVRAANGQASLDGASQILPAIYQINDPASPAYDATAFQNITSGYNGFYAGPGYNLVTGWGTPDIQNLARDLVNYTAAPVAHTVYWTGAAGDDVWNDPGNWSYSNPLAGPVTSGVLPGAADNVVVNLSNQTILFGAFGVAGASYYTIAGLSVTGRNDGLYLAPGTLDLSGNPTNGTAALGNFAVNNTGDFVVLEGGVIKDANIEAGTPVTASDGFTSDIDGGVLRGTIEVQNNSVLLLTRNWVNYGTITADFGSGLGLGSTWQAGLSDPDAALAEWKNFGTITENGGGFVYLGGYMTDDPWSLPSVLPAIYADDAANSSSGNNDFIYITGTLDNVRNTLTVPAGAQSGGWFLFDGRIDGGTVNATSGSLIALNSAGFFNYLDDGIAGILDSVTLQGTLDMTQFGFDVSDFGPANVLVLDSLRLDNATILLGGDGSSAEAVLNFGMDGGVTPTLSGTGSIVVGPDATAFYQQIDNNGTGTLTVPRGIGITTASTLGFFADFGGSYDFRGTIDATSAGVTSFVSVFANAWVNDGTIGLSTSPSSFTFLQSYTGSAGWVNDGTITDSGGDNLDLANNWINNGTINITDPVAVQLGSPNDTDIFHDAAGVFENAWINYGTITIPDGSTIDLGGIITTDDYQASLAPVGILTDLQDDVVNLTGTVNNSRGFNPVTRGTLALSVAEGTLNLDGGEIYLGNITSTDGTQLVVSSGQVDAVTLENSPALGNSSAVNMQAMNDATLVVEGGLTVDTTLYLGGPNNIGAVLDLGDGDGDGAPETIGGDGTIQFGSNTNLVPDDIDGDTSGAITFGPQLTIRCGTRSGIFSDTGPITNYATIDGGSSLLVFLPDAGFTNRGTINAGALLNVSASSVDNQGTIQGGTETLIGATGSITNEGTIPGSASLIISVADGSFLNAGMVQSTGNLLINCFEGTVLDNLATGTIEGGSGTSAVTSDFVPIDNAGTIEGGSNFSVSSINAPIDNQGIMEDTTSGGELRLSDTNGVITNLVGGTLTGGTWTIGGGGSIEIAGAAITSNAATINVSGSGHIFGGNGSADALAGFNANTAGGVFNVGSGYNFTAPAGGFGNAGVVSVAGGGKFSTAGTDAYVQSGGSTAVEGTLAAAAVDLNGGSLSGTGTVVGNLDNVSGTVSPGAAAPGTLTVDGNYTQGSAGALDVDIASASVFSSLAVGGTATLAGTLHVDLSGRYTPDAGTAFAVLSFASRNGSFATVTGLSYPGGFFQTIYQNGELVLLATRR